MNKRLKCINANFIFIYFYLHYNKQTIQHKVDISLTISKIKREIFFRDFSYLKHNNLNEIV